MTVRDPMSAISPPRCRNDFKVAIICTLPVEAAAVEALFDAHHDETGEKYGKAPGDTNAYMLGRMGLHDVVLAFMPNMGKGAAAGVAASLRSSYPQVQLALILGVCGGVPRRPDGQEILLGDVVVSEGIVNYDVGRRYPDKFVGRDAVMHRLHRPTVEIQSFIAKLQMQRLRGYLPGRVKKHLSLLRSEPATRSLTVHPGWAEDKLFKPWYHHQHHHHKSVRSCGCGNERICDRARVASCQEIKCDKRELVPRQRRRGGNSPPMIHFGLVASGDTLMRSGIHRDAIASREKVIAFEMEAAGVWDILPCMLIKGVSDYADSHKNKIWQRYASAAAAACLKSILEQWTPERQRFSPEGQDMRDAMDARPDSWKDGVWIGASADSSVVASTLTNEGGINLHHHQAKESPSNKEIPISQPRPKNGNYRVEIEKDVIRSVVANTLTNTGGINL
ncbi:hypothetical protein FE257_004494 [Aspergillus nanangensis]|uniref:Nucleoside phosphorylase domain-containing protein n=1 Tax=Aspergillus nanangensis TaxID=2582783 RepID=A0AAD4CZW2_ASPNN|nr:hypothetical protein FE257_004494 [Aspergillus nanangensis]